MTQKTPTNEEIARSIAEWAIDEKLTPIIDRCAKMIKDELDAKDAAQAERVRKIEASESALRKILDEIGNCDHAHDLFIEEAMKDLPAAPVAPVAPSTNSLETGSKSVDEAPAETAKKCEHDSEYAWILVKEGHNGSVTKRYYEKCPYCPKAETAKDIPDVRCGNGKDCSVFYVTGKSKGTCVWCGKPKPEPEKEGLEAIAAGQIVADLLQKKISIVEAGFRITEALKAEATRAKEKAAKKIAEYEKVFRWLSGEEGDFPARQDGEGAYWWRKELRKRIEAIRDSE